MNKYLTKYICIKDFKYNSSILFRKDEFYYIKKVSIKNCYDVYDINLSIKVPIKYETLKSFFMSFKSWREERINSILED